MKPRLRVLEHIEREAATFLAPGCSTCEGMHQEGTFPHVNCEFCKQLCVWNPWEHDGKVPHVKNGFACDTCIRHACVDCLTPNKVEDSYAHCPDCVKAGRHLS